MYSLQFIIYILLFDNYSLLFKDILIYIHYSLLLFTIFGYQLSVFNTQKFSDEAINYILIKIGLLFL